MRVLAGLVHQLAEQVERLEGASAAPLGEARQAIAEEKDEHDREVLLEEDRTSERPPAEPIDDRSKGQIVTGMADRPAREQLEPDPMEVESARVLEMDSADVLEAEGFSREAIRRLANDYIALDVGTDTDTFIAWVREQPRD